MEEKKKKNSGIFIVILVCIAVLLLVIGLLFKFNSKVEKPKENPEDKRKQEEKLAKSILTTLNIDDCLGTVFYPSIELNKNILDVSSNQNMVMYFYANSNLAKYRLSYGNDDFSMVVKYDDYFTEHNKVFGVPANLDSSYADFIFAVPNLPQDINNDYQINISDIADCDTTNSSNCFIILSNNQIESHRVKFSDLSIKNNIIESNLKVYSGEGESEVYLDGDFKFEFEKTGDSYIAKSLIITYVADAYNGVNVVEE